MSKAHSEAALQIYLAATQPYLLVIEPQAAEPVIDPSKMPILDPPRGEAFESQSESESPHAAELSPEEAQINTLRAQMHGNASVALRRLQRHKEVIDQCTYAIELDPCYVKAYLRRADSHESLGAARAALADYKKCTELDPTLKEALAGQARVGPAATEEERKQLDELKSAFGGLANKFLGMFGMSTENFQMIQDPSSGGYSVNFKQNP